MELIESKITIKAPKQLVWGILADFDRYHEWNPFTPKIELEKKVGADVLLHVRMNPNKPKIIKQKETLLRWDEGARMDWGIKDAWYVKTVRIQELTEINKQTTEYFTSDGFAGSLTGLILMLYRKKIQNGFDAVAQALKVRAESFFENSVSKR